MYERPSHGVDPGVHGADDPFELSIRPARAARIDDRTCFHDLQVSFRDREVQFHERDVIEGRDRRRRRHESPAVDITKAQEPREWHLDQSIFEARDYGIQSGRGSSRSRTRDIEFRFCREPLNREILESPLLLGIDKIRTCFGEQCFFLFVRELDQYGTGFDVRAILEIYTPYAVGHLGSENERFIGPCGPERLREANYRTRRAGKAAALYSLSGDF